MKTEVLLPLLRLTILLGIVSLTVAATTSPKPDKPEISNYQYEDLESDEDGVSAYFDEVPCPRDCICQSSLNSRIARCSRLEVGTQKFGDVSGIIMDNIDKKHPLILTDMMFRDLKLNYVTSIQITNSTITSISPTAFKGLHVLYNVNLSGNSIERIDPNVFLYNDKLSLVDLSDNPLVINEDTSDIPFINSASIQELELSRCGISSITKNTFSKLPNLMYINLSGNQLKAIDSSVFAGLGILEEVDLGDNLLNTIPDDLFINNSEITTIRLKGNPINTVIGVEIPELLTIDLSMDKISTVGPSMFDGMPFISNLNLSGNGIRMIHYQAFHMLTSLSYLDLSNNFLDFVSDQLLKENVELDIFKIARNPFLKSLPEEGFTCSTNSAFNIYLFDASHCSLEKLSNNTFKTMPSLSQLFLSHNKITSIGSALQKTRRLVELDLSFNLIAQLDTDAFSLIEELNKLNLAGNPLVTLSAELFVGNPILTWLDISSCQLNTLWAKRQSSKSLLSKLHFLNVSNNNIKSVSHKELQTMERLITLDISQNPLECNEDFRALMTWLGENEVSPAAVDFMSSKMELSQKGVGTPYKWQFLAKTVCTPNVISTTTESDDISYGNILKKFPDMGIFDSKDGNVIDEVEVDDYVEGALPSDYSSKVDSLNEDSSKETSEDLKNSFPYIYKKISIIKDDDPIVKDIIEESKKTEKLLDELDDDQDIEEEWVETYMKRDESNLKQYLWPSALSLFSIVVILMGIFMMVRHCAQTRNEKGFRCAVISSALSNPNRVKKDCGLVYQQLSEDLSGPKTPIVSRQLLTGSQSYQCSPFHHKNITPEHV